MSRAWHSVGLWPLSVAEGRGAVRWQVWQGQTWMVTRSGLVYACRFVCGGVMLRRYVSDITE